MHRISLRGPWNLAIFDDRIEGSRKFHTPSGMVEKACDHAVAVDQQSQNRLFFGWHSAVDWSVDHLRLNELRFLIGEAASKDSKQTTSFSFDSDTGVGTVEFTGILRPFNEIVLVWSQWPDDWRPNPGRYRPHPQHPIHFDSWLDIHP